LQSGGFAILLAGMNFKIQFLLLAWCGATVMAGNADPTPSATNFWKVSLPDGYGDESSAAIAPDGTIYQGTFRGGLFAISPEGKIKWRFQAGREIKSSPAVGADGTIYFGSRDWKFYALTPQGGLKWVFATGAWVDSSPAIARDGTVYFGSWDTNFYALTPNGSLKWKFATGGQVVSSPAIGADGTVFFGSHDRKIYALTPEGKLKWQFITGAPIEASPAIGVDGTVFCPSADGNLYALHPDGTEWWHLHTGGYTQSSPVLDEDGNLYLMVNHIHTSISYDGKIRWQHASEFAMDTSAAVTANGQVCFSIPWLTIGAFDSKKPAPIQWRFKMDSSLCSSPNVDSYGVIYACDGRNLYALQPFTNPAAAMKSPWPLWRANPQHTGRVEGLIKPFTPQHQP
jgi:outer membrane protein assembly factor BamB